MARKYIRITTEPEIRKGKKGYSFRFRIPAHDNEPERKSPWQKATPGAKIGIVRQEAEEYRQELEEEINDWQNAKGITLGQYARKWHEQRVDDGTINELSADREALIIKQIEESDIGAIPIAEIETEDIELQKKKNAKANWSKNKQSRFVNKVKQITRTAKAKEAIRKDIGAAVGEIKIRENEKEERNAVPPLVVAEMLEVLESEPKDGKRAVVRVAIGTAYRRGECLGLIWKDINFRAKYIDLQRQLNAKMKLVPPKYNSKGILEIDDGLVEWLEDWYEICVQTFGISGIQDRPVCCNSKGEWLNPTNVSRWIRLFFSEHGWGTFEKVEKVQDEHGDTRYHRTGFKGYKLHELRHYLPTTLIAEGIDIRTVMGILRHKRMSTTEQYTHEVPENMSKAMQGLKQVQDNAKSALEYSRHQLGFTNAEMERLEQIQEAWEKLSEDEKKIILGEDY